MMWMCPQHQPHPLVVSLYFLSFHPLLRQGIGKILVLLSKYFNFFFLKHPCWWLLSMKSAFYLWFCISTSTCFVPPTCDFAVLLSNYDTSSILELKLFFSISKLCWESFPWYDIVFALCLCFGIYIGRKYVFEQI